MFGQLVLILSLFSAPVAHSCDLDIAKIEGYPKKEKHKLYRAKGYDPYIYLGNYPFREIV